MTVLSAKMRKAMPMSDFAMPGRRFPISDKNHARMAISGATRAQRAGNITPNQAAQIKAKARRKLNQ